MVCLSDYKNMSKDQLLRYIEVVIAKIRPFVAINMDMLLSSDIKYKQEDLVQVVIELEGNLFRQFPDKITEIREIFNTEYAQIQFKPTLF